MPAIFGMMAAGFVLSALGKTPLEPKQVEIISESFRRKLLRHLTQREKKEFNNTDRALIADECEVAYVAEDVWCSRSVCIVPGCWHVFFSMLCFFYFLCCFRRCELCSAKGSFILVPQRQLCAPPPGSGSNLKLVTDKLNSFGIH